MICKKILFGLLLAPTNLSAELSQFSLSQAELASDVLPSNLTATVLSDTAVRFECAACAASDTVVVLVLADPKNTESSVREGRITSDDFYAGSQLCNSSSECLGGSTFIEDEYAGFVRAVRLPNSQIVITRVVSADSKLISITSKSTTLETATANEAAIWDLLAQQIF